MTKQEKWARFIYYSQEAIVLIFTVIAVITSTAIEELKTKKLGDLSDLNLSVTSLFISILLALMCYGTMYSKFKYIEQASMPPLIKRVGNSIMTGISWKTIVGLSR
jgi:ABC-type antimicrobial peptide transport system permease subunit